MAGGIVVFASTGRSIIGQKPALDTPKVPAIEAVSGNSGLFADTFNNTTEKGTDLAINESKVADAEKKFEERNLTDRISIDLFAKYLMLKQSGKEVDAAAQKALIDNVIEENSQKIEYVTYVGTNLTLITSPSEDFLRQYGNNLGQIVRDNSPKGLREGEIQTLARILKTGSNTEEMNTLHTISDSYRAIAQALSKMSIPREAKDLQLNLINASSKLSTNVDGFTKFETDSTTTIIHISAYDKNIDALVSSIKALSAYFVNKGVVFTPDSAGYAFTHAVQ